MYNHLVAYHILNLIKDSLETILQRFNNAPSPDSFLMSESGMMCLDSICMKLTAIGESVKNLDKVTNNELLKMYPNIPWKNVMGIRDIIVHHYFDIDAEEIFRICKEDIPILHSVIQQMINDISD